MCVCVSTLPRDKMSDYVAINHTIGWFRNGPGHSDAHRTHSYDHNLSGSSWSYNGTEGLV